MEILQKMSDLLGRTSSFGFTAEETYDEHDGNHVRAIERLSEAADRYSSDPRYPEVLYRLADSYRSSAVDAGERRVENPTMPLSELRTLDEMRVTHLFAAKRRFHEVIAQYDRRDGAFMTDLQRAFERNAYLYRGDCTFELGSEGDR